MTKFGDVVDCTKEELPYIADKAKLGSKTSYLQNGDVIIADTAEDDTVGKATEIFNIQTPVVSGLHTMACRPRLNFESRFLGYYINSDCYHNQLYPFMQGVKVTSISKGNIALTKIRYPANKEQQKIASMIALLDDRIKKQQQLIDSLKLYKRGLINNLFDRKIKTTGTWKKYALSEVLTERKTYCEKDGTYEHATLSKDGVYGKTERYDRDFLVSSDDKKYKITKEGDLCYNPANLKFGVICLNTYGDAIFSPIYVTFEIATKFDKHFIAACVTRNDFVNAALRFQQGTVYERMAVSPEDLLSMKIELPEMSVQKHFSNIFQKLDLLIAVHEKQFESMVAQKRTLLQQMFI